MNNQPSGSASPKFIHWFSYKKLPVEIQQRLLNLQNGEGNYIKRKESGSGCFIAVAAGLVFVWLMILSVVTPMIPLGGFWIIFFVTFLVFLIVSYFVIQIVIDWKIPLKPHTFITPTQVITSNGNVIQAANLSDIANITHVITRNRKGGKFENLELKFPDNSILRFSIRGANEAAQLTQQINEWNGYARSVAQQGSQEYFQRQDIFQGISFNDFHLYAYQRGCLRHLLIGTALSLLFSTLIVVPVSALAWYRADAYDWNEAVRKTDNNIGTYKNYLEKHPNGLHRKEASDALERLYREVVERTKAQTNAGADPAAIESLVQAMESSKSGGKNRIIQFYESENKISAGAEQKLNDKLGKDKILPLPANLSISLTPISESLVARFKATFPERAIWLENYNEYTKTAPDDTPVLRIKYTVAVNENDKPNLVVKTSDKQTVFYPEMTVDFDCSFTPPGKSPYQYKFKSVPKPDFTVYSKTDSSFYQNLLKKAFLEFENDFARRFGLKEPAPEKK